MWKCKRCGYDRFYQPFRSEFIIIKADKKENVIESENSDFAKYGRFYCADCGKAGWTLSEIAEWVEDEE